MLDQDLLLERDLSTYAWLEMMADNIVRKEEDLTRGEQ